MSLVKARMAPTKAFLRLLRGTCCLAGLTAAISCSASNAQENVFRVTIAQIPAAGSVPLPKKIDDSKASNPSVDINIKPIDIPSRPGVESDSTKEKAGDTKEWSNDVTDKTSEKKLEPLVVPRLSVPNTSIQRVGTGEAPEDAVAGRLPNKVSLPYGADRYGYWSLENKTWTAPVFCHQPVYFEDTMLERHGHERVPCLQPLLSGTRFFTNIAFLPYQAYLQRPLEERYNTGYYRPGSAAPCVRQRSPYDAGALRFQLLTTGLTVAALQP